MAEPTLAHVAQLRSAALSSPLQQIAMGLVIVFMRRSAAPVPSATYDVLPDPIGWALVLAGVPRAGAGETRPSRRHRWLAVAAGW